MPKIAQDNVNRDAAAPGGKADLAEVMRKAGDGAPDAAGESARLVRTATSDTRETAREAGEGAADAVRESARFVRAAAADTRETARHSSEATVDAGRMFVDIVREQARDNMQTAGALAHAGNWSDIAEVQRVFLGASFARMSRLGEFYCRIIQGGPTSAAPNLKQ